MIPPVDLDDFEIGEDVLELIPEHLARQHTIIPIDRAGSSLIVAMSNPSDLNAIDDVKFHSGLQVEVVIASELAIREASIGTTRRISTIKKSSKSSIKMM